MSDTMLLIDGPNNGVTVLTLHRPDKMNALATPLLTQVAEAIEACDRDDNVRAIVLTGGDKVFAAGADINEIRPKAAPVPGAGGAALLPRIVGPQKAMRMVLLGEFISAQEALDCGLVSEVTDKGAATARATELAVKIAKRAPLAIMQGKAIVKAAQDMPLAAHLAQERQAFSLLFSTDDKNEGIDAFLEKRKPVWTGK